MVIASVFALVLAAAAADDGPIATDPALRPNPPAYAAPAQPVSTGPIRDPDIPASAPTDDYGFVAWCEGALRGHMELHDKIKPELDRVSPGSDDHALLEAGQEYLDLYAKALAAAEKASPTSIHNRGMIANDAGYRIWGAARAAEARTQMWSYLMWELPPRCEIAAKRLEERSSLLGAALRSDGAAQPVVAPPPEPDPAPSAEAAPAPAATEPPPLQVGGLRGPQ